MSQLDNNSC